MINKCRLNSFFFFRYNFFHSFGLFKLSFNGAMHIYDQHHHQETKQSIFFFFSFFLIIIIIILLMISIFNLDFWFVFPQFSFTCIHLWCRRFWNMMMMICKWEKIYHFQIGYKCIHFFRSPLFHFLYLYLSCIND